MSVLDIEESHKTEKIFHSTLLAAYEALTHCNLSDEDSFSIY